MVDLWVGQMMVNQLNKVITIVVEILENFFRKSLEYADTTWGKGR